MHLFIALLGFMAYMTSILAATIDLAGPVVNFCGSIPPHLQNESPSNNTASLTQKSVPIDTGITAVLQNPGNQNGPYTFQIDKAGHFGTQGAVNITRMNLRPGKTYILAWSVPWEASAYLPNVFLGPDHDAFWRLGWITDPQRGTRTYGSMRFTMTTRNPVNINAVYCARSHTLNQVLKGTFRLDEL